jgi:hypothetical protein
MIFNLTVEPIIFIHVIYHPSLSAACYIIIDRSPNPTRMPLTKLVQCLGPSHVSYLLINYTSPAIKISFMMTDPWLPSPTHVPNPCYILSRASLPESKPNPLGISLSLFPHALGSFTMIVPGYIFNRVTFTRIQTQPSTMECPLVRVQNAPHVEDRCPGSSPWVQTKPTWLSQVKYCQRFLNLNPKPTLLSKAIQYIVQVATHESKPNPLAYPKLYIVQVSYTLVQTKPTFLFQAIYCPGVLHMSQNPIHVAIPSYIMTRSLHTSPIQPFYLPIPKYILSKVPAHESKPNPRACPKLYIGQLATPESKPNPRAYPMLYIVHVQVPPPFAVQTKPTHTLTA